MKKRTKKFQMAFIAATLGILLAGCASNQQGPAKQPYLGGYTYSGVSFGKNLSENYKRGVRDGCETAKGYYTKSHELFNTENDYYRGWFAGRHRCRHLLVVEID